jgi:hypothetical protein
VRASGRPAERDKALGADGVKDYRRVGRRVGYRAPRVRRRTGLPGPGVKYRPQATLRRIHERRQRHQPHRRTTVEHKWQPVFWARNDGF